MSPHAASLRIALLGNPNCGKTALFNLLTGSRQKVANFAGVTVERKEGALRMPDGRTVTVLDLPGAYSLHATSAMFWGAASYNNGILDFKNTILGESYNRDGIGTLLKGPPLDPQVDPLWMLRQSLSAPPGALLPGCGWLPDSWMAEEGIRKSLRLLARGPAAGALMAEVAASRVIRPTYMLLVVRVLAPFNFRQN